MVLVNFILTIIAYCNGFNNTALNTAVLIFAILGFVEVINAIIQIGRDL